MHTSHAWLITADHIDDVDGDRGEDDIGRVGPGRPENIDPELRKLLAAGEGEPFQLFDDNILYYEGRVITQKGALHASQSDDHIAFAVLRWGADAAGCTIIRYWIDGEWRQL